MTHHFAQLAPIGGATRTRTPRLEGRWVPCPRSGRPVLAWRTVEDRSDPAPAAGASILEKLRLVVRRHRELRAA